MYFAILENTALFLLAGGGCYAIFATTSLREQRQLQQILIGLLLGLVSFSVVSMLLKLQSISMSVNGMAGPLVLSAYLGGPLAGAITVLFASFAELAAETVPGPASILFFSLIMAVGLLARHVAPSPIWPGIPRSAIAAMLGGFLVVSLCLLPPLAWLLFREPLPVLLTKGAGLSATGLVSITVLALILRLAAKVARDEMRVVDLDDRLKLLLKTGKFGMFEYTSGDARAHHDIGIARMYGLTESDRQIEIDRWLEMILPEDRDIVRDNLRDIWRGTSQNDGIEFRARRTDGAIRHLRLHRQVERDTAGRPKRIVGIQEDITGQREIEHLKSVAEARLERILDNLPGAVISLNLTDPERSPITYISPYVEEIWGYTAEELMAEPELMGKSFDPQDRIDYRAALRKAREDRSSISRRLRIVSRTGETLWLDARMGVAELPDGSVCGDGIVLDVTREVESQQALEEQKSLAQRAQRNESIGQLTGGVAHDFNNLLAVVMGNLELLKDDISDPEQLRLIQSSLGAIERGADLTRSLLAFALQSHLEPQQIDLNTIVSETHGWAGRTLPERIKIEAALAPDLWPTRADPASTQSALLNLIVNARDAMPEGGLLRIQTSNMTLETGLPDHAPKPGEAFAPLPPGRYVVLSVTDTGDGIPPEKLRRIFEPFYTTKPPGSGSGLGLSMVQGFMQQTGGAVHVRSDPGEGTAFKLFFPVAADTDAKTPLPEQSSEPLTQPGLRILLVEDEREVLETIRAQLQKIGFRVMSASSGDSALELFREDPTAFDLLLTDIVMPGSLQGPDLGERLRGVRPDLPIIFLSGYATDGSAAGPSGRQDDIHLMKPVSRTDLLDAIARSVRR